MNEVHISSLVLHVKPELFQSVNDELSQYPQAEISGCDATAGKLVIVLETDSMGEVKQAIADFEACEGVLTVTMVYHHAESDESMKEDIA